MTTVSWTRRTVERDGVRLAVHEAGVPTGPTLVMVHGWPDTHRLWLPVAERLAPHLRLVAYDTRGQGDSPLGAPDPAFALPELAADLLAVVDAVTPDAPAHVIGHDWGSVQAWEAVCEPAAAARVASFTSMSGPNLDHTAAWLRRSVRHPSIGGLAGLLGQAVSSSYLPLFVSPLAPPLLHPLGPERWRRLLEAAEGAPVPAEAIGPSLRRDMVSGLRYYRANLLRGLPRPRERRTSVPVLQLVLEKDTAVRPATLTESERWCDRLEQRRLPHGHWAALTAPDAVAAEVLRFARSVDRPGRPRA
jgi:pimeloyl-ACP methyl ester carboxylesterase